MINLCLTSVTLKWCEQTLYMKVKRFLPLIVHLFHLQLTEYLHGGGILGLSRKLEEQVRSASEGDGDEESTASEAAHSSKQDPSYSESNQFPFPLTAPGLAVFIHPPDLISELYPPGFHEVEGNGPLNNLEKNIMNQQNPEVLSQLICERWFLLCYRTKPCPTHIWEWLFQIMCRSCDHYLADRAHNNLMTLIQWTRSELNGNLVDITTRT